MSWLQIRLAVTPENAARHEDLLLAMGAVSVTFMDAEDQPIYEPELGTTPLWSKTHLLGLFDSGPDAAALEQALKQAFADELPQYSVEELPEQDWERSWMDDFKPMRFGRRLWIVPSWHSTPEPDAVNMLLDPGLAFGTGTHPTTALCLEWLDGHQLDGLDVLDFGCGSGILAIAALLLGARHATCTDIDPQALEATAANAGRNAIEPGRYSLYLPEAMPGQHHDLVLANILAGPLVELAPQLAAQCRPGGHLVLSGILAEQADQVREAYADHFKLDPVRTLDGWVLMSGIRQ